MRINGNVFLGFCFHIYTFFRHSVSEKKKCWNRKNEMCFWDAERWGGHPPQICLNYECFCCCCVRMRTDIEIMSEWYTNKPIRKRENSRMNVYCSEPKAASNIWYLWLSVILQFVEVLHVVFFFLLYDKWVLITDQRRCMVFFVRRARTQYKNITFDL